MMVDEDTAWVPKGYEEEIFIMCPHCGRRTEKNQPRKKLKNKNTRERI